MITFDDLDWTTKELLTKRYTQCTFGADSFDGCPQITLYDGPDAGEIDMEAVEDYLKKKNMQ